MARRLENLYGRPLDADPEKDVERDVIQGWADNDYDIDEKEKREAEQFEKIEKAWKEARSVAEQIKALDGMSREQLETKREELLSQGMGYSLTVMDAIEKRIVESLDGMTREQLENEKNKLLSLEKNTKYPYFLSAAIDKRIRQAERLEKDALNKSTQSKATQYTGPLAGFMVHSEEGKQTRVDASIYETSHDLEELTPASFWRSGEEELKTSEPTQYTSNQVSNEFNPFMLAYQKEREQLEAKLVEEFETTKSKEAEIVRIDKATHGLQELAQGHEIEIDKGDKDF